LYTLSDDNSRLKDAGECTGLHSRLAADFNPPMASLYSGAAFTGSTVLDSDLSTWILAEICKSPWAACQTGKK